MEGFDPDRPDPWGYYAPTAQQDIRFMSLVVRAAPGVSATALTPGVRATLRGIDPDLPMYNVLSMQGVIDQGTWFYRVFGTLFITFGAAALFMATVGLYGVLSFSVSRRLKEMGIRMALGASAQDIVRLVMRQGGRQIALGMALGLVMAYGLTRIIGILMFEVTPQDPPVFTIVFVTIALVGLLASLVPARRATTVSPIVALRYE
jgi:ABC-type antimicrobial peptide transport system permease subunit